jgi:hypothetical protein
VARGSSYHHPSELTKQLTWIIGKCHALIQATRGHRSSEIKTGNSAKHVG